MHLWHPLTLIKGNDEQGEEEKGVISERNRLIIDLFQYMFPHCSLIVVNQVNKYIILLSIVYDF